MSGARTIAERGGHTQSTYELAAQPTFDVPELLLKRDASEMLGRLKAEIAARTRLQVE